MGDMRRERHLLCASVIEFVQLISRGSHLLLVGRNGHESSWMDRIVATDTDGDRSRGGTGGVEIREHPRPSRGVDQPAGADGSRHTRSGQGC
ncbi:MAG: hypothetical protein LZF60_380112 [Nitrospira sp.]|nr:MAG: hypothetical protein LZF60_380112 [Nitrospira sp.]